MKILKLFQKQFVKYLFFFIVAVFLVSNIFVCHIYASETFDLDHDLSDSCNAEKESLVGQDESQFFAVSNASQTQNNQELAPDFSSDFISSEDLDDSQAAQLLAVVKIE